MVTERGCRLTDELIAKGQDEVIRATYTARDVGRW